MHNTAVAQGHLSVIVARTAVVWYVFLVGPLTVLAQLSLLVSIRFELFASLAVGVSTLLALVLVGLTVRRLNSIAVRDWLPLLVFVLAGILSAGIVLFAQPPHRFGATNLDDYYYLANPTFYVQNPTQPLAFELRDLYSGFAPFKSVAFFTAGAFQYVQAAFAYILGINYLKFAYFLFSPISGFLFPVALYLVLTKMSDDTLSASVGTFAALVLLLLLGESERSPGNWIFSRVSQGKSIVVSTGVCLLVYFSLEYFKAEKFERWLALAITVTALAGMSTTAIMFVPAVYAVLFVDHYLIAQSAPPIMRLLRVGIRYIASLIYLILYGGYVWLMSPPGLAAYANRHYPVTFNGFVKVFFAGAPFWATLVFFFAFSVMAVAVTGGAARRFVIGLIVLPFLILNPWVSPLLIPLFPGIYFRLFYILPLILVIGLSAAQLFRLSGRLRPPLRVGAWLVAACLIGWCFVYSPTSSLHRLDTPAHRFSDTSADLAQQLVRHTPSGLMLAPYPLSSVVFSLDPTRQQLYIRPDITEDFLWVEGRKPEADLRRRATDFLRGAGSSGDIPAQYQAFTSLLEKYPAIRVVVIKLERLRWSPDVESFLEKSGFGHSTRFGDFYAFWR